MIYEYSCPRCNQGHRRVCRLADYVQNPGHTCQCGSEMKQIIFAPRSLNNTKAFEPFRSPVDGSIICSKRELAEHNKRNNVVNLHDGYDEKALNGMSQKDFQKPLDEERRKDLKTDAAEAINMLQNGYTPTVAPEGDPE